MVQAIFVRGVVSLVALAWLAAAAAQPAAAQADGAQAEAAARDAAGPAMQAEAAAQDDDGPGAPAETAEAGAGTDAADGDRQAGGATDRGADCPPCAADAAADPAEARVAIELNKLEPVAEACRAYLVVRNDTGIAFESLQLDLVLFDNDDIVAKRLAVETAPLPAGKTSLKVFDIAGLQCDAIGQILLNNVLSCEDAFGKRDDCLALLAVTSRGMVPFIK